jgi:hypothetical protein
VEEHRVEECRLGLIRNRVREEEEVEICRKIESEVCRIARAGYHLAHRFTMRHKPHTVISISISFLNFIFRYMFYSKVYSTIGYIFSFILKFICII